METMDSTASYCDYTSLNHSCRLEVRARGVLGGGFRLGMAWNER